MISANTATSSNTTEMASPVLHLLWAAWFLFFDSVHSTSAYLYLTILTSEEWAFFFTLVAAWQMFATIKRRFWLRVTARILTILLWLFVLILFILSNYKSQAVATSFFVVYVNILSLYEIAKNR